MFPDCKRPVRCCDGFIVCDNNHGKSIARTSYLRRLTHHRHSVVEGGEDFSSQVCDAGVARQMQGHAVGQCGVQHMTYAQTQPHGNVIGRQHLMPC